MKNWVIQGILYDFNPSLYNYIKLKWLHFHFCKKDDPTINVSLYLDNLAYEVKHEITEQKSVNKKSLNLAVILKILENRKAKQEFIDLLDKKPSTQDQAIKQFLSEVSFLIHSSSDEKEQIINEEEVVSTTDFPVRTYVIATHIYLEINNNELHYETLIRDTTALKEFISAKFKANKIAGRIADMKNFSYKKILQSKNTGSAKGQLLPQLKQIANNPPYIWKRCIGVCGRHFERPIPFQKIAFNEKKVYP